MRVTAFATLCCAVAHVKALLLADSKGGQPVALREYDWPGPEGTLKYALLGMANPASQNEADAAKDETERLFYHWDTEYHYNPATKADAAKTDERHKAAYAQIVDYFDWLAEKGITKLISLSEHHGANTALGEIWKTYGEEYQLFESTVEDFGGPEMAAMDTIFKKVEHWMEHGHKVAVFCGAGWGRTGEVIAALFTKLNILKWQNDNGNDEDLQQNLVEMEIESGDEVTLPMAGFVEEAVAEVRSQDAVHDHGDGEYISIERKNQLEWLNDYADHVLASYDKKLVPPPKKAVKKASKGKKAKTSKAKAKTTKTKKK